MDPADSQFIASIASSVTSAVAIGGLIFTIWKTRGDIQRGQSERLAAEKAAAEERKRQTDQARQDRLDDEERTRREKIATKRSEVAGEAMVATIRFLHALRSSVGTVRSVSPDRPEPTDEREQRELFRLDMIERWNAISETTNGFIRVWEQVETYLPQAVHDLFTRIWQLRAEIRAAQQTYFAVPPGRGDEQFMQGWGGDPERAIDAIHVEVRNLLRPLVKHFG